MLSFIICTILGFLFITAVFNDFKNLVKITTVFTNLTYGVIIGLILGLVVNYIAFLALNDNFVVTDMQVYELTAYADGDYVKTGIHVYSRATDQPELTVLVDGEEMHFELRYADVTLGSSENAIQVTTYDYASKIAQALFVNITEKHYDLYTSQTELEGLFNIKTN